MTGPVDLHLASALLGPDYTPSGPVTITIKAGLISAITPASMPVGRLHLAIPALADAHNHARPLSTTSFGCGGSPLETWLPKLALMPAVDPYLAAAAAFGRSLRGGATAVMVHLTRAMGQRPLPDEARQIARAAADVGIAIGFAVSLRDRNPLIYDDHEPLLDSLAPDIRKIVQETWMRPLAPIAAQLAQVDAVAEAVADMPGHVDVQYGPTGVQWCSDDLLQAVASASQRTGRRVHMHFLETRPQREWADRAYPDGLAAHLQRLGLLSPRLTLAHGVWARADDLALIALAGARIAVNVSSNLHLYSGIAPVAQMVLAGVDVAMGLDGCALDEDDDGLRELRLFHLLNHAAGFETGGLRPPSALRAACATGRAALGLGAGGILAPGMPADLLVLDLDALNRDALMPVDPTELLFARAHKAHITEAYAAGRQVMAGGRVLGIDLPKIEDDLRTAYRAALCSTSPSNTATLRTIWPTIEGAIAAHYRGCC